MKVIIVALALVFLSPSRATAQEGVWGEPLNLSNSPGVPADHPIVIGDAAGRLHVFWIEWDAPGSIFDQEQSTRSIFYARMENGEWTDPNSILITPNWFPQNEPAAAIDQSGILHFTWGDGSSLYYSQAFASNAESAQSWSEPLRIAFGFGESDIKVDSKGNLHVVYTSQRSPDVWHMRSRDGGQTWSAPVLAGTIDREEGVNGLRLAISGDDTLHVAWSLDKFPRGWPSMRLLYARSSDGGETWEDPRTVASRETETYAGDGAPWFLFVATDGANRVFLTWDGAPDHERHFQQSFDRGETWQEAQIIFEPHDRGRNRYNPLVVDNAGNLHVVTANYSATRYTSFNGNEWTLPMDLGPEAPPKLAITEGNILHLVRRQIVTESEIEVLYNSFRIDAPHVPPRQYPVIASLDNADKLSNDSRTAETPSFISQPPESVESEPQVRSASLDSGIHRIVLIGLVPSALITLLIIASKTLWNRQI